MKVAIVTYFFPKITETFILNRITGLIDRNVEVVIIARKNPALNLSIEDTDPETLIHDDIERYALLKKTIYLSAINRDELNTILANHHVDLVHFQWGWLAELMLKQGDLVVPTFVNFHEVNLPSDWNLTPEISKFENVIKTATLVLPTSEFLCNALLQKGGDPRRLIVHYTGVDPQFFYPPKKIKHGQTGMIQILSNGSFIEKKGHEYSLTALGLLKQKGVKNFHHRIIGEGKLRSSYEKIINKYDIRPHVTFLGKLTRAVVAERYRESDIFMLPSVVAADGSHEGIPLAIMEASATGLPVISTYHTGIPEVVEHERSGLLAEERNPEALANYLKILIENPQLRQKLGQHGRRIIEQKFDVNKLIDLTIQLYKQYR